MDIQSVHMIVHVMVMVIKKNIHVFAQTIIIVCAFILISCSKNNKNNISDVKTLKQSDSISFYIHTHFINAGSSPLNTQENFRHKELMLKSNGLTEQAFKIDKPSVLEKYSLAKKEIKIERFIVFDKDSLSFDFKKGGSIYTGNKRNNILNELISDNSFGKYFTFTNLNDYINNEENQYLNRINKLKSNREKYSNKEIESIETYLKLYKYYKILFIDYALVKNDDIKIIDKYYNLFSKDYPLINKINTILNRSIMNGLIRYFGYKKGIQSSNILDLVSSLDPKYYKTKELDGFLNDYIDYICNGSTEKTNANNKLKQYMLSDRKNENIKEIKENIFNSNFETLNGKIISFKDIVKTDKKLILIDLWASWCVPCINEIPKLQKFKNKYSDRIHFVTISIDEDSDKWKKSAAKHQIDDDHSVLVIDPKKNSFIKELKINSIPRFILLNNKGGVISDDFYRPSDNNFEFKLKQLLDK